MQSDASVLITATSSSYYRAEAALKSLIQQQLHLWVFIWLYSK